MRYVKGNPINYVDPMGLENTIQTGNKNNNQNNNSQQNQNNNNNKKQQKQVQIPVAFPKSLPEEGITPEKPLGKGINAFCGCQTVALIKVVEGSVMYIGGAFIILTGVGETATGVGAPVGIPQAFAGVAIAGAGVVYIQQGLWEAITCP